MFRGIVCALGALLVAGCATTEMKPGQSATGDLRGRTVYIVKDVPPSFGAVTSGKAMFAVVGAVAAHSAGDDLVRENGIEDPALTVEWRLARHLHQKFGAKPAGRVLDYTQADKPSNTAGWAVAAGPTGVIIDVETRGWNFWYFPTTWSKYRVGYSAVLKLIDGKTGRVMSQYLCSSSAPENAEAAPTHDEMLADGATLLKTMLHARAEACADQIIATVL